MKSTTAITSLIFALLSTSISAAPTTAPTVEARANTIAFQLANDQSGHYANVNVPADGVQRTIQSLFGKTAIANQDGIVIATSAMLSAFQQDSTCTLSQNPELIVTLNAQRTWASLEQGQQVDLEAAYLVCKDL